MQAALVVTFTGAVPGRERLILEMAAESGAWWEKQAAEGRCSPPQMFHGTSGLTIWFVTGDDEELRKLEKEADAFLVNGRICGEDWKWEIMRAGDATYEHFGAWAAELQRLELW